MTATMTNDNDPFHLLLMAETARADGWAESWAENMEKAAQEISRLKGEEEFHRKMMNHALTALVSAGWMLADNRKPIADALDTIDNALLEYRAAMQKRYPERYPREDENENNDK